MQKYLQRRLKSKDRYTRYSAMDELVELGTEESIEFLKQVVEGRRRIWLINYDFNDQVHAMNALLKLNSEKVNAFLRNILHEHTYIRSSEGMPADPYYGVPHWEGIQHSFPNARGELQKRLTYFQWADSSELICAADGGSLKYNRLIGYDEEAHVVRKTILDKTEFGS